MSDIASPRIESYYLHPKKYAWRSDKEVFAPDQSPADGDTIASAIKERFKMVISAKRGAPNQMPRHASQDTPLDFSVKTTDHSPNGHQTDSNRSVFLDVRDRNVFREDRSNVSDREPPVPASNGRNSQSPASIYHGSPNFMNQRSRNSDTSSTASLQSPNSHAVNAFTHQQLPAHPPSAIRNEHASFTVANRHGQTSPVRRDEAVRNGSNSPRTSPSLSRETTPERDQYRGSILHEALARNGGDKHKANALETYLQSTIASSRHQAQHNPPTPPFKTSAISPVMPDPGSVWPPVSSVLPGPSPLLSTPFNFFNGLGFAPTAMAGMSPYMNGNMDGRLSQTQNSGDKKLGKPVRPFKALTNELLFGLPTLPVMNPIMPSGGYFQKYVQGVAREPSDVPRTSNPALKKEEVNTSAIHSSPPSLNGSINSADHKIDVAGSGDSNCSFQDGTSTENAESGRKRGRTLPEDQKDDAYWERRRKNNQAAKRSRDARRQKEDLVAQQAWLYREENMKLRLANSVLEENNQRLQIQYRAAMEHNRNLELQNRLVSDEVARSRCGKCGSRTDDSNYEAGKKD